MRLLTYNFALVSCLALLASAQDVDEPDFAKVPAPPSAETAAARDAGIRTAWKNALNLAHEIAASQGYRRRDTRWVAALPEKGFSIIPLQLYAGNDYYVVLGTDAKKDAIAAVFFDPDRMLIKNAPQRSDGKLVFHITPEKSGPHYLRLHVKQGSVRLKHCALTYIYK